MLQASFECRYWRSNLSLATLIWTPTKWQPWCWTSGRINGRTQPTCNCFLCSLPRLSLPPWHSSSSAIRCAQTGAFHTEINTSSAVSASQASRLLILQHTQAHVQFVMLSLTLEVKFGLVEGQKHHWFHRASILLPHAAVSRLRNSSHLSLAHWACLCRKMERCLQTTCTGCLCSF